MPGLSRRSFVASLLALPACSVATDNPGETLKILDGSPPPGTPAEIAELEAAILALGPEVDPEEAARAARASFKHTHDLAIEYQITDPALIHNTMVNMGLKPRGLCKHWAEDMERMLLAEDFQTLTIHRAIGALIGVDHSTAIISRKGDDMYAGIVVDPWRDGGTLTWIHTIEDTIWGWEPRLDVLDRLARIQAREQGETIVVYEAQGIDQRCLDVMDPDAPSVPLNSPEGLRLCATLIASVEDPAAIAAGGAAISF